MRKREDRQTPWNRLWRLLRRPYPRHSTGQAYVELLLTLSFLSLIIAGVLFFGQVLYANLAVSMASYDGARAAVEALEQGAGTGQGREAAYLTFTGFHMNPAPAQISVYATSGWGRGREVVCDVSYDLSLAGLPFVSAFFPPSFPVHSRTSLRVETYRSDW